MSVIVSQIGWDCGRHGGEEKIIMLLVVKSERNRWLSLSLSLRQKDNIKMDMKKYGGMCRLDVFSSG
jgi:hypothetical protein